MGGRSSSASSSSLTALDLRDEVRRRQRQRRQDLAEVPRVPSRPPRKWDQTAAPDRPWSANSERALWSLSAATTNCTERSAPTNRARCASFRWRQGGLGCRSVSVAPSTICATRRRNARRSARGFPGRLGLRLRHAAKRRWLHPRLRHTPTPRRPRTKGELCKGFGWPYAFDAGEARQPRTRLRQIVGSARPSRIRHPSWRPNKYLTIHSRSGFGAQIVGRPNLRSLRRPSPGDTAQYHSLPRSPGWQTCRLGETEFPLKPHPWRARRNGSKTRRRTSRLTSSPGGRFRHGSNPCGSCWRGQPTSIRNRNMSINCEWPRDGPWPPCESSRRCFLAGDRGR